MINIQMQPSFTVEVQSARISKESLKGSVVFVMLISSSVNLTSCQTVLTESLEKCFEDEKTKSAIRETVQLKLRYALSVQKNLLDEALLTELPVNESWVTVALVPVKPEQSAFDALTQARKLSSQVLGCRPSQVIVTSAVSEEAAVLWSDAFVSALTVKLMDGPSLRSQKDPDVSLKSLCFIVDEKHKDRVSAVVTEAQKVASWTAISRQLATLPANILNGASYVPFLQEQAEKRNLKWEFLSKEALAEMGANAFLAVVAEDPGTTGIFRALYRPHKGKADKRISLIGKGIMFDTGGLNVKGAKGMLGMHGDMQGSAIALSTFFSLVDDSFPEELELFVAIGENHIGPRSYKPGDVVTALNGKTIEVIHTDAEGRMVLADAIALAARERPALIMDFATLTGACVQALGSSYHGAYTTEMGWLELLISAGKETGERVWVFPNDEDFGEVLKSKVADIKQCTLENKADHILGGHFLKQFVGDIPYVHIDLSASENVEGVAHAPGPFTGLGVRFSRRFLKKLFAP